MEYPVERIDYAALVQRMFEAGAEGMGSVLNDQLNALGTPTMTNEVTFFWRSLYNAARKNDPVFYWLLVQPNIRHHMHFGAKNAAIAQLAPESSIPLIGGIDDTPYVAETNWGKQWPAEPIGENFIAQTEALDAQFRETSKSSEDCFANIADYVRSFYWSGSGQAGAQIFLFELGYGPWQQGKVSSTCEQPIPLRSRPIRHSNNGSNLTTRVLPFSLSIDLRTALHRLLQSWHI